MTTILTAKLRAMPRDIDWPTFILPALLLGLVAVGPLIAPYDPLRVFGNATLSAPSTVHPFGTDVNGMDVLSRVLAGARIDIGIAVCVAIIAFIVGVALALVAGYYDNWVSSGLLRLLDMVQAFPLLVVALVIVELLRGGMVPILVAASLLSIPIMVRVVRPVVMEVRQERFVEASVAGGANDGRIIWRHVAPHVVGIALAQSSLTASGTIILVTGMSFIGVGYQAPTPEWGAMVAQGSSYVSTGQWWVVVFPGLAIAGSVLAFNVIGDRLRRQLVHGR